MNKCKYINKEGTTVIAPVLSSLLWLPVQYRIDYKILLIVFKALHNMSPNYIAELLGSYVSGRT